MKESTKELKELIKNFPYAGEKIRCKGRKRWTEGLCVIDRIGPDTRLEYFIEYADGSREQLDGLRVQIFNNDEWIDKIL